MNKSVNWASMWRLRFIEVLLAEYGVLNRRSLETYFSISTPQASIDIRDYMRLAPENMAYDTSVKAYRRLETFQRFFQ